MKLRRHLSRQERRLKKLRTVTFNVAKLQELKDRIQADIDKLQTDTIHTSENMSNESDVSE